MILTCPECGTRYKVDPSSIGPEGRPVHCSRCDNRWTATPFDDEEQPLPVVPAEEPAVAEPVPASPADEPPLTQPPPPLPTALPPELTDRPRPSRRRARERHEDRRSGLATALWVILIVVVGGTVGAALMWRDAVIRTWPAAAPLYDAVGFGKAKTGHPMPIGLVDTTTKTTMRDGIRVVIVEGQIVNQSEDVQTVPSLQATISDKDGKVLRQWTVKPPVPKLVPGERVAYRSELENPPVAAARIAVAIAPPGGGKK